MIIDTENRLKLAGGDTENSHLSAPCDEKKWKLASPEFGNKEGMKMLIKKTLCSVKTSGRKFLELIADVLRKIGFGPARYDDNVWINPREDGHDYVATHMDGFIVVAKDIVSCIKQIKENFNLR